MGFKWTTAAACAVFSMLSQPQGWVADAQLRPVCFSGTDDPNYLVGARECVDPGVCQGDDVKIESLDNVMAVTSCSESGDNTLTFTADVIVTPTGSLFDLGLFVDFGTAASPCKAYTFACSRNVDDRDDCGDVVGPVQVEGGINTYTGIEFTIPCDISDGQLVFPYCIVWETETDVTCNGPSDVAWGDPSKCKCSDEDDFVAVEVCEVFVDTDVFAVVTPDPCPAEGSDVTVTIPASSFVGTEETTSGFTVSVGDNVDLAVSASDDLVLDLPNGDYTLTVTNPSYGTCSVDIPITIDCPAPTPEPMPGPTPACDTSYGCQVVEGESCTSPQLNDIKGVKANRWGWYIRPTFDGQQQEFTFEMYAGAGQNVLANGEHSGQVVVLVNADGSSEYTVHPADGYCFDDVHVHVGNELPTKHKKGGVTVAPGQYTQSTLHEDPFYIIVHVGETCTPCGH